MTEPLVHDTYYYEKKLIHSYTTYNRRARSVGWENELQSLDCKQHHTFKGLPV